MRKQSKSKIGNTSSLFAYFSVPLIVFASTLLFAQSSAPPGPYGLDRDAYIVRYKDVYAPVIGQTGMVATQSDFATRVGELILNKGGNAIDASVAVGFALAVTLPRAGNLGGGGFMLIYDQHESEVLSLDYRETAPSGVSAADFLNADGSKNQQSKFNWSAVGVPGTVAGLHAAWEKYGSMPWAELVQPSIDLAKNGFEVNYDLAEILDIKASWLQSNPATKKAFYKANGQSYVAGEIMRRPNLAKTLELIAKQGPDVFYKGEIAKRIAAEMQAQGGYIDLDDLAAYQAKFRPTLTGTYRGYQVAAMPPPSSGGVAIIEALNILENFDLNGLGYSADYLHLLAETMKLAFADRGEFLADPDFVDVPIKKLLDKNYAKKLANKIQIDQVLDLSQSSTAEIKESPSTTHYSIVDKYGNAVSNTYTLSSSFGAGLTIPETGILLNNQIHTFSVRAGIEGAKGFIASQANRVEEGKRPVSSQSPTIVLKDGKPYLIVGSPGGSRIITAVLQMISNVIDLDMNVAEATNQRRIHHQWIPDYIELEPGFNTDTARLLEQKGHKTKTTFTMGSTQSIQVKDGYLFGSSDPRRPNALSIGIK